MPGAEKSRADTTQAGPSRRAFLGAAGLVALVGAGGGAAAEVLRRGAPVPGSPRPPDALVAAIAAERERVQLLDAALAAPAPPAPAALLSEIRANHLAHEQALRSLLPRPATAGAAPSASASPAGPAPDRAALARSEATAATDTAGRALSLAGGAAALLASIAACEATHAQVLA